MKIYEAAIAALNFIKKPATASEVYETIVDKKLYVFGAKKPVEVLRVTMDKHTKNKAFSKMNVYRYFYKHTNGKYELLEEFRKFSVNYEVKEPSLEELQSDNCFEQIFELATQQKEKCKAEILTYLRALSPSEFEEFSELFLNRYGFKNMTVTSVGRDGGIDVKGALKIGIAEMRVAAQCKRYAENNKVGRPDVSQFRGDITGEYEQGIFITTSSFTKEAKEVSFKPGCVPIVLIDGEQLAETIIEKGIGIQRQQVEIYDFDADLIFS
ncbi:restriction endonuclease [Photobacterium kishitanii]|uniref:Restriction endonuclease n=1 Tax=Photobacterium kishitanii TaxID=318456 RepID=A0A2T3KIV4_9GAMM|nr:restriction endonuclease [Photobacterium kishitanii]PSU99248.1 restriction endonuclease [Photobacterium kishitanii]